MPLTKTQRGDLSRAIIDYYDGDRHQFAARHSDLADLIVSEDTTVPARARELAQQRLNEAAERGGVIGQSARTWLDKLGREAVA